MIWFVHPSDEMPDESTVLKVQAYDDKEALTKAHALRYENYSEVDSVGWSQEYDLYTTVQWVSMLEQLGDSEDEKLLDTIHKSLGVTRHDVYTKAVIETVVRRVIY